MFKKIGMVVVLALGIAAGWAVRDWLNGWRPGSGVSTWHSGPTIEQVRALSELVTTRVDVADVQETQISGYTGGIKAAILVKGDFLLGVDLSKARFESMNAEVRTAVLVLPQPQVSSPRVDHERTRLYAVGESGLWKIIPGDAAYTAVIDLAYREAQRIVGAAADQPSLIERSRRQAQDVLGTLFEAMGWQVTVKWA